MPEIQNAIEFEETNGGVTLSRRWLDNVTTTVISFSSVSNVSEGQSIQLDNRTVTFPAGAYQFAAHFNYPQLEQLSPTEVRILQEVTFITRLTEQVLNPASQELISQYPDQTTSLSFLSYENKLLAGAWRFLTYFGRDSMIAMLLLGPVLSEGEGGAIEAGIAAVLERINQTDGNVCHEETIG